MNKKILLTISIAALSCMSTAYAMDYDAGYPAFRDQYLSGAVDPDIRKEYEREFSYADSYHTQANEQDVSEEDKASYEGRRDKILEDLYEKKYLAGLFMSKHKASNIQNPNPLKQNAQDSNGNNESKNKKQPQRQFVQQELTAFELAKDKLRDEFEDCLGAVRNELLKAGVDQETHKIFPKDASNLQDVINKFKKGSTVPGEQERLQCEMDRQAIVIMIKHWGKVTTDADFMRYIDIRDLTPDEIVQLRKIQDGYLAQMQKDVGVRIAKLPPVADVGIFSKTKTFIGNHKLMMVGITTAVVGTIWYMRAKADELDLKGRVKAFKNYVQTKLGLKKNFRRA